MRTNNVVMSKGNTLPIYFEKYPKIEPIKGRNIAAYSI